MKPILLFFIATCLSLTSTSANQAKRQPPAKRAVSKSVSNGNYKVTVRVEKTRTFRSLFVRERPRSSSDAFLVVYLKTNDPCLNPLVGRPTESHPECGDALKTCGEIETATGKIYEAHLGGQERQRICIYVVPSETAGKVTLRLKGYPDLQLDVK